MPTGSFEKNSFSWQVQQLQQRIQEWGETINFPGLNKMSLPSWFNSPILQTIAKVAFWTLLGLFLIWAIWQIGQMLRPYFYPTRTQPKQSDATTKRSENELSLARWLERSQKFQQQGNYREACLCLYMAMLQRLSDTGIVPHQPSRTDGEYLKLIQNLPQQNPYKILLMTHQQLCFGNGEASRSVFDKCQQAYREIETL